MSNGHGGKRNGSGRPRGSKTQKTLIREKAIAEAGVDAEYALGLFITWQKDKNKNDSFRAGCAREVMDRVWGRPTQHKIVDATVSILKGYADISPDDWDEDDDSDEE